MSNNSDDPNDNENAADSAQLTPNPRAMRAMLNWLFDGAPKGSKIEIAHGHPEVGPNTSRQFDVKDIDAVVAYAVEQNFHGHNCYVGAALRRYEQAQIIFSLRAQCALTPTQTPKQSGRVQRPSRQSA